MLSSKKIEVVNIGNHIINHYLIKLDQGYLLIDTGYAEQFNRFCRLLKKEHIELTDIRYILLTHAHDDHSGFINEILDRSDAKIIMHPESLRRLKVGHNSFEGGCSSILSLFFCMIMKILGKGKHQFKPVDRVERTILFNEHNRSEIEEALSGKLLHLPGHTSDSIGILLEDGSLFCGDAAMNGFPSLNRNIIWIENLKQYSASWNKMIENDAVTIYPSHGKPFDKSDLIKNLSKISRIKLHPLK